MKKRAAFILAFVMLTGVLVGLMPVSAAGVEYFYHNLSAPSGGVVSSLKITLGAENKVKDDYNHSIVQVSVSGEGAEREAIVYGISSGSTVVNILDKNDAVIKVYNITVSAYGSGALEDVNGATVTLTMTMNTQYSNVFPGEKFTVTAVVTNKDGNKLSESKMRYNWSLDGSSGIAGEISTSSYGSVATITLKTVPFRTEGTAIKVNLTVYGNNSSATGSLTSTDANVVSSYNNADRYGAGIVKAYCGQVNFTYLDRDNGNAPISAATLGTLATFTNLGRTYTAPVGRSVGMVRYMADASPRTVTFYPGGLLSYDIIAGVKKGAGSSSGTGSSSGYGFMTLPNGYTIIEVIENSNNLAVMKPGSTQQITSTMLGGVPVTAPLMTYKITDPKVAVVSNTGLITALSTGVTTLEVYCNGVQVIGKFLFVLNDTGTPEPEEVEGLVIKTTSITRALATQKNVRFRVKAANITFNGAKVAHKNLEWSSSKTSVATVDANGYVSIKAKGTCYIYGTYTDKSGEEYTARFKVTVK